MPAHASFTGISNASQTYISPESFSLKFTILKENSVIDQKQKQTILQLLEGFYQTSLASDSSLAHAERAVPEFSLSQQPFFFAQC